MLSVPFSNVGLPIVGLAVLALALPLGPGCASPRRQSTARSGARTGDPQVPGFPPLPDVETTATLALAGLLTELPTLPAADGVGWVEETFVPWMQQREVHIARAAELRRAARGGPTVDQAVSAALHGAILQETLQSLALAYPERIDPSAAEALEGIGLALAAKARRAFEVCHQLALDAGVALDGWRQSCDERLAHLPQ